MGTFKDTYKLQEACEQDTMELYLLHLELDGGLEVVGLGRQVIVVGHQGGELTRLGSQERQLLTELLP